MTDEELMELWRKAADARYVDDGEPATIHWAGAYERDMHAALAELRRLRALERVTREYYAAIDAADCDPDCEESNESAERLRDAAARMDAAWRAK